MDMRYDTPVYFQKVTSGEYNPKSRFSGIGKLLKKGE